MRVWRSGWAQVLVALVALVLAFVVIWWRGPDWGSVLDAFRLVIWSWIVLAFLLNIVSTLFRALSWRLTVGQALPAEHQPRMIHVLSSFGVGLLANAIVPGRLGELARVATLRRHLPDAPPGTSAVLVGTVFAHRLFDLVPATDPRRLGVTDCRGAALGRRVLRHRRVRRASRSSPLPGSVPSGTTGRSSAKAWARSGSS